MTDSKPKAVLLSIVKSQMFFPFVCLLIVLLFSFIATPDFFEITIRNGVLSGRLISILNRSSELVILAVGMTMVIAASGGTDISVGAVMALSGAFGIRVLGWGVLGVTGFSIHEYVVPWIVGALAALAIASLCGLWSGFLVAKLRIQPMVATLILLYGGRGLAQLFAEGQINRVEVASYGWLGGFFPGVPVPSPIFVAIAVVIITALVLRFTAIGLQIQSVGVNRQASRLFGLNSSKVIWLAYAFSGLCAGIAGLIATSRISAIDATNAGLMIELDAILAVALGGNSLGGGKFNLAGSVIGAITIQTLTTSMYAMEVTPDQLNVVKAIVVVIIVSLQSPELRRMLNKAWSAVTGARKAGEAA